MENKKEGIGIGEDTQAAVAITLAVMVLLFPLFFDTWNLEEKMTGNVPREIDLKQGCCEDLCSQTTKEMCSGLFHEGKTCKSLERCVIGCCVDKEGYCLSNYLQGNCKSGEGRFVSKKCGDILSCKYGTKPLIEKSKKEKLPKIELPSPVGYVGSLIPLRFVLEEDSEGRIIAEIRNLRGVIGAVELFDDGFHNDGSAQDGVYGNVWASGGSFEGAEAIQVDFFLVSGESRKRIGEEKGTILSENYCFPIKKGSNAYGRSVVFFAQGYAEQEFSLLDYRLDVERVLFTLTPLLNKSALKETSIYRFDRILPRQTDQNLKAFVRSECPFFNFSEDVLFVIDADEEKCSSDGEILRMGPKQYLRSLDANRSLDGRICQSLVSEEELKRGFNSSYSSPRITFNWENQTIVNTSQFNISVSIDDEHPPLSLLLFLNGDPIKNLSMEVGGPITFELNGSDGEQYYWVQARNSLGAYSWRELRLIINSSLNSNAEEAPVAEGESNEES